jgi:methionyl-tRNA formyltransferase
VPRSRILLLGEGPTAASALDALLERFHVVGVVRTPPAIGADAVIARAEGHGVPVLPDASLPAVWDAIHDLAPQCVVVSSYDRVLPAGLLTASRFVNVHYAPLPAYRGRANVNWAIINGEAETAITVHVLDRRLDAGGVLFQAPIAIGPDDTVADLYARLNDLQRAHLADAVAAHLAGDNGTPQDGALASYGCTRLPEDGEIDWSASTREIYALVRALVPPYPGAFTYVRARRLVICRASPVDDSRRWAGRIPGRVAGRSDAEGWVDVLTGDGVLRLQDVEPEGLAVQPAAEAIHSVRTTLGLRVEDLLARIHALEAAAGLITTTHRGGAACA